MRSEWEGFTAWHRKNYPDGTPHPPSVVAQAFSALALVEADPADALEQVRSVDLGSDDPIHTITTLLALGLLDEAVDRVTERVVKGSIGWTRARLSFGLDGLLPGILYRLVADNRPDLIARYCDLLTQHDSAFLGSVCLSMVLSGREDAAAFLSRVPADYQRRCFLSVLSSMPSQARPTMAALLPSLPPSPSRRRDPARRSRAGRRPAGDVG